MATKRKIISTLEALLLIFGTFAFQACFSESYSPPPAYGYGYGYAPPSVAYGDYDDHHVWHDRDWWEYNNHQSVAQHHPDWDAPRAHHEAHRQDSDHNRDHR